MTFDAINLNTPLRNALEDLGYAHPTKIQVEAFSPVLSGSDVVGIAQTGTGKTLAYLLPILKRLKYSEQKRPRVLIVVPTRELVTQVIEEIKGLTAYMNVRIGGIFGGTNINTQKQMVHEGLDVLVATPGRLIDICLTGILRLKDIQTLVIDEVDEMLNLGFRPQLLDLMDLLPPRRQNLLFSATLTEDVEEIIIEHFNQPLKVEVAPHGTPLDKIEQLAYHLPNYNTKLNMLQLVLEDKEEYSRVLVFAANKRFADRLFDRVLAFFPEEVGVIHSNKAQNNRFNTIESFEKGELRILIATDIIARGLDIQEVSHVINFDMPEQPSSYIHRIGRTGRADKEGVAINLVSEKDIEHQMEVEKMMGRHITVLPLPEDLNISTVLIPEEEEAQGKHKIIHNVDPRKQSQGAFHEKKDKNQKVNRGGTRKLRAQAKANRKKGGKKRR